VLCGILALTAVGIAARVLQWPRAAVAMRVFHASELRGKVAVAAVNFIALPSYRGIYSTDDPVGFRLSCNDLNRRGWLRPPLWDERFVRTLAALSQEPAFGRVSEMSAKAGSLHIAGRASPADAVIVTAGSKIVDVLFPDTAGNWSGDIPATENVRCFAYDAATGAAHLLPPG
jgi:hypothetical protein